MDVLRSSFFTRIREAQPYGDDNLLRPCLIIDHPAALRQIVASCSVHPTHPGAEGVLHELATGLDDYSDGVARLFDPLWEKNERARYLRSLEKEDKREVHQRFHRRESV